MPSAAERIRELWKAPLTLRGMTLLGAARLGVVEDADDGVPRAAHHDLAGGVDRADLGARLTADVLALGHVEPDNGGHRALALPTRRGHQLAPCAQEADGVVESEGARGDQRGVLAERMPRDEGRAIEQRWLEVGRDAQEREAGDGDRGLRVLRLLQLFLRALEADAREGHAEDLAGAVEELAGSGELVVEVLAHAHRLGALPGEDEGAPGLDRVAQGEEGAGRRGCYPSRSGSGMRSVSRPRYVPHTGHVRWASRGARHWLHVTTWGARRR